MAQTEQTYQNHTRWFPLFHFVIVPLLLVILIWNAVMLYMYPSWDQAMRLLFVVVAILIGLAARLQALRVQDRVIRLEETLRHLRVLPPELSQRSSDLSLPHVIALRFAPDEELSELVERTLNGEFVRTKDIKLSVKKWRPDHLRA